MRKYGGPRSILSILSSAYIPLDSKDHPLLWEMNEYDRSRLEFVRNEPCLNQECSTDIEE